MANNNQNPKEPDFGSILKAYDEAISHYDFVINDLSSEIYNPALRAGQAQAVAYLTAMRNEWKKCRADAKLQIDKLNQQNKKQ